MTGLLRNMQGVMHKLCGSFVAWTSCYINVQHKQHPAQQSLNAMLCSLLQAHLEEEAVLLAARRVESVCHLDEDITRLGLHSTNYNARILVVWSVKQVAPRPSQTRGRHRGL